MARPLLLLIEHRVDKLRPVDAIHLASALRAKCDVLLTWDGPLAGIHHPGIRIEFPRMNPGTKARKGAKKRRTEDEPMMMSVFAAVLLSAATTTPVGASECFGFEARTLKQYAALVFEGTIIRAEEVENDELEITMEVHRVWKGEVGKKATVYHPAGPLWGSPPEARATTYLTSGDRLVVFTNVAFEGRPKLAQHRTSWVAPCYGLKRPNRDVIKRLGRSRKPKEAS